MAVDNARLLEKEKIFPNQHFWPEIVVRKGEKRGAKHSQGKVNSVLTAQHIGEPNHMCPTDDNPYGAGEQSGKRANPDACSADANTRAHKAVEQEVLKAELPLLLHLPTSQPLPAPRHLAPMLPPPASQPFRTVPPMHTPAMYSPYPFQPPLAPLSQLIYSHSQGPASLAPPYYSAFNFSTYTYSHHM